MNEEVLKQQNKRFISLVNAIGKPMATFCCCAVFNKPLYDDVEYETWVEYLVAIRDRDGIMFHDGITNVDVLMQKTQTNVERWKNIWGTGGDSKPYTVEDYRRLDDLFATYSSRLQRAGGMDAVQDDTLRQCSKFRLESDKALAKGGRDNIQIASTLSKMIQDMLSAEQLRKKDAKPVETARVDGIVEAIARKYGVGVEMTQEQAIEICAKWLTSHEYPMTADAADKMLFAIINCTRNNNDMPELKDLPETHKFSKTYTTEFLDEQSDAEEDVYRYLHFKKGKLETNGE